MWGGQFGGGGWSGWVGGVRVDVNEEFNCDAKFQNFQRAITQKNNMSFF